MKFNYRLTVEALKQMCSIYKKLMGRANRPILLGVIFMNADYQATRRKTKASEIGVICKNYREKEHLTVRHIANCAGYLPQTVYAFENGRSNATILSFDCYFNQLNEQHQIELFNEIKGCLK